MQVEQVCPKCGFDRVASALSCARCGVIFAKLRDPVIVPAAASSSTVRDEEPQWVDDAQGRKPDEDPAQEGLKGVLRSYLWTIPARQDKLEFNVRVAVVVVLSLWGAYFITLGVKPVHLTHLEGDVATAAIFESFMHNVDLIFHEAGHLIFAPLGRFMSILGGSLMQVLMPLICMGTLLIKHQNSFGGAVALWWVGQSLLDLAPYIYDARPRVLMLLGGGNGRELQTMDGGTPHDWYNILSELGWLAKDQALAYGTWAVGAALVAGSMLWAGALLWRMRPTVEEARF